jgi:hypothetical protein
LSESGCGDENTHNKGSVGTHEVRFRVNEVMEASMAWKFARRSDIIDQKWNPLRRINTIGSVEGSPDVLKKALRKNSPGTLGFEDFVKSNLSSRQLFQESEVSENFKKKSQFGLKIQPKAMKSVNFAQRNKSHPEVPNLETLCEKNPEIGELRSAFEKFLELYGSGEWHKYQKSESQKKNVKLLSQFTQTNGSSTYDADFNRIHDEFIIPKGFD